MSRRPLLLAALPFLMGASAWDTMPNVLAIIGDALQQIVANEQARFALIIIIVYTLMYGLLSQAITNVRFFGGEGALPSYGKTFAFAVTLSVTIAVGYVIKVGPLAQFNANGSIVIFSLLVALLIAFGMRRKGASAHSTGMLVSVVVFALGYFTDAVWMNIIAFVIFLFSFFSMISAVHLQHASPYSGRNTSGGERERWYHAFGRWVKDFAGDIRKGSQLGQDVMNSSINLFNRLKRRREEKSQVEGYRGRIDQAFQRLKQAVWGTGTIPQDVVQSMKQNVGAWKSKLKARLKSEEEEVAEEARDAQEESQEEKLLGSDEGGLKRLNIKGRGGKDVRAIVHTIKSLDEASRKDLKKDRALRKKVHKLATKEYQELEEFEKHLERLIDAVREESAQPTVKRKRRIIDEFSKVQRSYQRLRNLEIRDAHEIDEEYNMSQRNLRDAYQKAKEARESRQRLMQDIQSIENEVDHKKGS